MFLRRVIIAGFKSFATRTTLELEPGVTAVVGPNGSGKSNVADAIRWGLGEQNRARLRLSERDEVIFAGSEGRPRSSMAEVTLVFDNTDGAFPLELTEIEIARRLYRSGESEFRLAGRKVPLRDITDLLSQTGFGSGTYAVIGQGMVDSFLLSSPSERKLLFDEAAGIRAPELKRAAATKQLAATESNLERMRDIVAELEPRLETLRRGLAASRSLEALAARLNDARSTYVATADQTIGATLLSLIARRDELTLEGHRLRHGEREARRYQQSLLEASRLSMQRSTLKRAEITRLEVQIDQVRHELSTCQSAAIDLAEYDRQIAVLTTELSTEAAAKQTLERDVTELSHELKDNESAARSAQTALEHSKRAVDLAQVHLARVKDRLAGYDRTKYVTHALELLKTAALSLDGGGDSITQVRLLVHKAGRLLSHATKETGSLITAELSETQSHLETAMQRYSTATDHQTNITITHRSLELDMTAATQQLNRTQARLDELKVQRNALIARRDASAVTAARENGVIEEVRRLSAQITVDREQLEQAHLSFDPTRISMAAAELEQIRLRREQVTRSLLALSTELRECRDQGRRLAEDMKKWGLRTTMAEATTESLAAQLQHITRLEADYSARAEQATGVTAEYEEVETRSLQLHAQIHDLENAKLDLEHLSSQLDEVIRERFRTNFTVLSEHFSTYFTRLFGGGSAALVLQSEGDGTYGVEISVNPQGKRIASLAALSGGERALAGVALLAAILHVNPSPFVVLDEVDAALDEANSGRLAQILGKLSRHSQLIVITHNRQTMQAARTLYGLTTDTRHISTLLSIRLDEATALAAR